MSAHSAALEAHYASPTGTHKFTSTNSSTASASTASASAQLGILRAGIVQMQSDVNAFLTAKMEDEKNNTGAAAESGEGKSGKKEQLEEDMYGEEEAMGDD